MDAKNATDPEGGLVLAIDIGGTLTKLGLVRRNGHILRAEVMPKCPSKALSLLVGIRASAPKDSISSASLYIFSLSLSLRGEYS